MPVNLSRFPPHNGQGGFGRRFRFAQHDQHNPLGR
jgi:hypothetical protein